MTPKLSIMIPTYNSAKYITDAINSVLVQDFQDFEILVFDNASTDNTEEIIKSYTDSRIRYYKNKSNIGAINNINESMKFARGIYLKHLCADDVFLPGILKKQVDILDCYSEVGLVTCDMIITDENLEGGRRVNFYPGREKGRSVVKSCCYTYSNFIGGPSNVMLRRDACLNIWYDPKLRWVSDLTFFSKILKNWDYYNIDEPGYYYRRHAQADTTQVEKTCKQRYEEIDYCIIENGFHLSLFKFIAKSIGFYRKANLLFSVIKYFNSKYLYKLFAALWSFKDYNAVLLSDYFEASISINASYSNIKGIINIGKGTSIGSFTVIRIENGPGTELETSSLLIGENTYIGELNNIRAGGGVIRIGDNVLISQMVTIVASNHSYEQHDMPIAQQKWIRNKVVIEDDVWIGAGVTILPGAYISKGAIVAANSVVNGFIAPNMIVAGSPAKEIKNRFAIQK